MIAGIDAQILIYAGVAPRKNAVDPKLEERAKILLHKLRNDIVVLPLVAIAELLIPVPQSKRGLLVTTLDEFFLCKELDQHAAAIAADIWSRHKQLPADLQYKDRRVLKADSFIIATAAAANAKVFYSHDDDCRKLAGLVMDARDLPRHSGELFTKEMIEDGDLDLPKKPSRKKRSKK